MNKAELVDAIAQDTAATKAAVVKFVDSFIDTITKGLKNGETIVIPKFGSFTVSNRAARTGRNPQTGAAINIAASRVARFKAGKNLKDAVK